MPEVTSKSTQKGQGHISSDSIERDIQANSRGRMAIQGDERENAEIDRIVDERIALHEQTEWDRLNVGDRFE